MASQTVRIAKLARHRLLYRLASRRKC
jgi:hypothetical protein